MLVAFENVNAADERTTPCLSFEQMVGYEEKTLSPAQYAAVDEHLTQCELCSEAMEGFAAFPDKARRSFLVQELHEEIQRRSLPEVAPESEPTWSERLAGVVRSAKSWLAGTMKNSHSILITPRYGVKLAYAMATTFLVGVVSVIYLNRETPGEKLFASYFQPYPNLASSVRGEQDASKLQEALQSYDAQDFEAALQELRDILASQPNNVMANFYAGISYLNLKETERAIASLQKVLALNDAKFSAPALWYLALAYLQQDQLVQARATLEGITANQHLYQAQAIKLLEQLRSGGQ